MVEYSKENRFPFHTQEKKISITTDDYENLYEYNVIFDKIIKNFPSIDADQFYKRMEEIQKSQSDDTVKLMKYECDNLLKNIREMFENEQFIHSLHDDDGFGVSKIIETLYGVYGYYFYTGKRTANVIKKVFDGYKKQPIY